MFQVVSNSSHKLSKLKVIYPYIRLPKSISSILKTTKKSIMKLSSYCKFVASVLAFTPCIEASLTGGAIKVSTGDHKGKYLNIAEAKSGDIVWTLKDKKGNEKYSLKFFKVKVTKDGEDSFGLVNTHKIDDIPIVSFNRDDYIRAIWGEKDDKIWAMKSPKFYACDNEEFGQIVAWYGDGEQPSDKCKEMELQMDGGLLDKLGLGSLGSLLG